MSSADLAYAAGHVCWIHGVPGLGNPADTKPRAILLIWPEPYRPPPLRSSLIGVAITSSPSPDSRSTGCLIALPDTSRYPSSTSGLDRPSWADARWLVQAPACRIERVLGRVRTAYVERAWELVQETRPSYSRLECDPGRGAGCAHCRPWAV